MENKGKTKKKKNIILGSCVLFLNFQIDVGD